ncbi:MAG: hypothetical protein A2987_01515 [Omnitrophica bacterium RIFCSPLOWO2_01_FULL_45_10]|nr:MAG: hypothetical protein A2987_01515 [Omnitrophica bacterium RIFCSPLOWO2_01_FULL_45_10]
MKNKNTIVVLAVVAAVIMVIIFIRPHDATKKPIIQKPAVPAKAEKGKLEKAATPVKKTFSKDTGGLTIKIIDSKGKDMFLRARAFKSEDPRTSVYAASFMTSRTQELPAGSYDIEIDTTPQRIYKDISISKGKETVRDLGSITGSINVKALNSKKKEAYYPIKALNSKSNIMVAAGSANRPIEIIPGVYDIEIGTLPRQVKKNVTIERSKEAVIDLGCTTGDLLVKTVAENNKEARYSLRIKKAGTNETVSFSLTNNPIEISQGKYDIEVLSSPVQTKSAVEIKAGEETNIEFTIPSPQKQ